MQHEVAAARRGGKVMLRCCCRPAGFLGSDDGAVGYVGVLDDDHHAVTDHPAVVLRLEALLRVQGRGGWAPCQVSHRTMGCTGECFSELKNTGQRVGESRRRGAGMNPDAWPSSCAIYPAANNNTLLPHTTTCNACSKQTNQNQPGQCSFVAG